MLRRALIPLLVGVVPSVALVLKEQPQEETRYNGTWESVDTRPLPTWYDDAKFGIFIHWGLFSVPSFKSEWYWNNLDDERDAETVEYHKKMYGEDFQYHDFAKMFTAKMFDPDRWASMFKRAGAKYVVLTTKHHEGFSMWPSPYSGGYNAGTMGPKRDLVGDLTDAVRRQNLTMGLYSSLLEWENPLYIKDRQAKFLTNNFVEKKLMPELKEMVRRYKPETLFVDGDWEADSESYWKSPEFLSWLYNDSPVKDTIVTNDRWGTHCHQQELGDTRGKCHRHGDYYTGIDNQHARKEALNHKWEQAMTIDKNSWGFSRTTPLTDYHSPTEILKQLQETVAYGGNLLLNIGPTKDGLIPTIFEERLTQVGDFLKINGEAIFGTTPWKAAQNETAIEGAFYTQSKAATDTMYLSVIQKTGFWPMPGSKLHLSSIKKVDSVELLTAAGHVSVKCEEAELSVKCEAPDPYKAGLADGNVHSLGFVLRLKNPTVSEGI